MSIYDLIVSSEIAAYWELFTEQDAPYFGEELFPDDKKLGLELKWLKGSNGLPVVLKASSFDAAAVPRARIGFEKMSADMPFFKESLYIDEELRQELNDEMSLLRGAAAQRERMRMMALTTGTIVMTSNGQIYEYDYGMPTDHKVNAVKSWSDPTAPILEDIRKGIAKIQEDTGVTVKRAVCSSKVFGYMRANNEIKSAIMVITNGVGWVSDAKLKQFIKDELDIEVVTNDKRYKDESNATQRYVEDDIFVMFPEGELGRTWFGTTPEESDLMSGAADNVTITDTGVAITTMRKTDPVQVETKVTQICLPDFPTADQIYVLSTEQG